MLKIGAGSKACTAGIVDLRCKRVAAPRSAASSHALRTHASWRAARTAQESGHAASTALERLSCRTAVLGAAPGTACHRAATCAQKPLIEMPHFSAPIG